MALRGAAESIAGSDRRRHVGCRRLHCCWPTSLLLLLLNEIGSLPLGFYSGYVLERRYGLSNESLGAAGSPTR